MILIMKQTTLTKKLFKNAHHINIEMLEKKLDAYQKNSSTFKCLNLFFKLPQNSSTIQVLASTFLKYDYNNLTFEVHANKSLKIKYPKILLFYPKIHLLELVLYSKTAIFCFF
jgi:hypothetical protein